MTASEPSGTLRYQVLADAKVLEKYLRRVGRQNSRDWLRYAASLVPPFCIYAAGTYTVAQMFSATKNWDGLVPALLFGFVIGPISALLHYETYVKQQVLQDKDKTWDCELTPDFYQFTGPDGVVVSVPWRWMKIESAEPEYWEISCRGFKLMVFREPLQKAGLESEFERRLGRYQASDDTST